MSDRCFLFKHLFCQTDVFYTNTHFVRQMFFQTNVFSDKCFMRAFICQIEDVSIQTPICQTCFSIQMDSILSDRCLLFKHIICQTGVLYPNYLSARCFQTHVFIQTHSLSDKCFYSNTYFVRQMFFIQTPILSDRCFLCIHLFVRQMFFIQTPILSDRCFLFKQLFC